MNIVDEKFIVQDIAVLLHDADAKADYKKHVESIMKEHLSEIIEIMKEVVEPFKPFAKVGACIASRAPYYYLDEDEYIAAAERGEVPTLPNKDDALAYLALRKVQVLNCCGYTHPCDPRLFGK